MRAAIRHKLDHVDPVCVECGRMGKLVSGAVAYPHRPEWRNRAFYRCDCGALVSCHAGTAIAAGRPASAATRRLRAIAHEAFDGIWSGRGRSRLASGHARTKAYKWLARQLGIPHRACHLGWMGADELRQVIEICRTKEAA